MKLAFLLKIRRKDLLLVAVLFFLHHALIAQWTEEWVRAAESQISFSEPVKISLHKDYMNNIFITSTNNFTDFYSSPFFDLSKMESEGEIEWSKTGKAYVTGIVFDDSNHIYLSGIYSDTVSIFGNLLKSNGEKDIYLAKLSPNGQLLWIKSFGGEEDDESGGLIISNSGKLVLVGSVRKNPAFEDSLIISDKRCKPFMATFDLDGNMENIKLWETEVEYTEDTLYSHMKFLEPILDNRGNIYSLWKLCDISVKTEENIIWATPSQRNYSYTLVKIDSSHRITKSLYLNNEVWNDFYGLTIDNCDSPYLLNYLSGKNSSTFILKFDTLLNSYKSFATPLISDLHNCNYSHVMTSSIVVDSCNYMHITGNTICDDYGTGEEEHNYFFQSIDFLGSQLDYKKYKLNKQDLKAHDLLLDKNTGKFYTVGYSKSGFQFDSNTISSNTLFLIKYSVNITDKSPTSVDVGSSIEEINISPNPSRNSFTINYQSIKTSDIKIKVRTLTGTVIYESTELNPPNTFQKQIDISRSAPGLYFLELVTDKERLVKKIIIAY